MTGFFIAFNAVLPIVLLVGFGYFLKEQGYFDSKLTVQLNKLCSDVLLPIVTFNNIHKTDIRQVFDVYFVLYAGFSIAVAVPALMLLISFIEKDRKKQGVLIQGIFRSNFVILGLPLSSYISGGKSSGLTAMLVMVIIPLFNALAVFILSIYGGCEVSKKKIVQDIVKNRMIQGSFLGILASVLQIQFPGCIARPLTDIGKVGGIFPMIVLGAMLDFSKISVNRKPLLTALFGKLIGMPAVFLGIAVLLGFPKDKLASLIALYGSPTAVISVAMAQQFGCDYDLAAQIVVFSTAVSCISLFLIVFCLSSFGIL